MHVAHLLGVRRARAIRGSVVSRVSFHARAALGRQTPEQLVPGVVERLGALALELITERRYVYAGLCELTKHVFRIAAIYRHRPGDVAMLRKGAQCLLGDGVDRVRRGERFDVQHIGGAGVFRAGARPQEALRLRPGLRQCLPSRRGEHLAVGGVRALCDGDAKPIAQLGRCRGSSRPCPSG